jgi:hypothetical protein
MTFKNPTTNAYQASGRIKADCTGNELRDKIRFYYYDLVKSSISVTRKDLDENGVEISVSGGALKSYEYEIDVLRLISSPTTNSIIIGKVGTEAVITVKLPHEVQLSSTPLSGSFYIECKNSAVQVSNTEDI